MGEWMRAYVKSKTIKKNNEVSITSLFIYELNLLSLQFAGDQVIIDQDQEDVEYMMGILIEE